MNKAQICPPYLSRPPNTKQDLAFFFLTTFSILSLSSLNFKFLLYSTIITLIYSIYYYFKMKKQEEMIKEEKKTYEEERKVILFRNKFQKDTTFWTLQGLNSPFNYDPTDCDSIINFKLIKNSTECIFAKSSNIWGCNNWKDNLTLEENVALSIPMLIRFFSVFRDPKNFLDGFVFEIVGEKYTDTLDNFAKTVSRVLKTVGENDPDDSKSIRSKRISKMGWRFSFCQNTIFITTFSPVYPETNSRWSFGVKGSCFILFQPEESFGFHDLSPDTPHTNWDNPITERDKIRVGFKKSGREYEIPPSVYYPQAEHIVKAMKNGDPIVKWWEHLKFDN